MTFHWGDNPAEDLTRDQVLEQMAMYIAALRIADDYGLDAVGIQYQQGLKDQSRSIRPRGGAAQQRRASCGVLA